MHTIRCIRPLVCRQSTRRVQEKFEDTKGIIKRHKSKDKQWPKEKGKQKWSTKHKAEN
jgi:hypothetical protein